MFTFAAFCYMLSLVLCASLIFFAIWHVSVCIFDVLYENILLQDGMHYVLEQGLLHQTKLSITWSKPPWHYQCLRHVLHRQTEWSFGCKLIVKFRLGWQHWRISWLGGSSLCQGNLLHTFRGYSHLSNDQNTFVGCFRSFLSVRITFQELRTCVKPPYSSTVHATFQAAVCAWPVLMLHCPLCLCTLCKV